MEFIKEFYAYVSGNLNGIVIAVTSFMFFAEAVTRLTPTKKDDGAVERLGKFLRKVADFLRIPNVKKKEGTVVTPEGTHPPKQEE